MCFQKKITIEEKDRAKVVSLLKEFQGVLDPSIIYLDSHQSHGTYNSIQYELSNEYEHEEDENEDENENENEILLKNLVHEHHFTQNLVCTGMLFNVFGFLYLLYHIMC